jgi:broad specificity phosphatase PhoE
MIGLLIRHGHTDAVGRWLAGRQAGVSLSADGRREAASLSQALRWVPVSAVYSSPLERARETAGPIAHDHGLPVHTREALTDVDFGAWTGKSLDELANDPSWAVFNRERCKACPPGGESLAAVQRRVVEELQCLARRHPGEVVAIVTHAEPIRCAIAAFECTTLDEVLSVDILPCYISTVGISDKCRRVLAVNQQPESLAAVCT